MMKNGLQRCLPILLALLSVAAVADGQTDQVIGKGYVKALQFSPDGRWLAIGTSAFLELYDAKTYQFSHNIEMNVDALEFSPDETEMLVADRDLLHRIDSATGQVIETLTVGEDRVTDLAYSSNGKQIASIDERGVVRLWERCVKAFTFHGAHPRWKKYAILFSPDGQQLIVGAYTVEFWDISTAQLVGRFFAGSRVTSLALHPDETQFAIGTEAGQVELRVLGTYDRTALIDGTDVKVEGVREETEVDSLAFSPDGQTLIVGFSDSVIAIWDTVNQAWLRSWITKTRSDEEFKGWEGASGVGRDSEERGWLPRLTLSRDGETVVAVADRSANVGRWEVGTGKLIDRFEGYGFSHMLGFSADGERFAIMHGGIVRVWSTVPTEMIAEIQYDNGSYVAAFSPNGKYVGIAHADRRITVWDVDTATVKHVLPGAAWNRAITFSSDSRLVAAVTFSGLIRVWEVETGEKIAELDERDVGSGFSGFGAIRFSPNGKWFATSGRRAIAVWETQGFTLHHVIEGVNSTNSYLNSLEFSPDSRWIAGYTGEPEYKIQFWNIETEEVDLELPTGSTYTVGFSPDSRWFTTSVYGPDKGIYTPGIQIWDTETGQMISELFSPYYQMIFSPDGVTIAVAYYDGRIQFAPIEAEPYVSDITSVTTKPIAGDSNWVPSDPAKPVVKSGLLSNYPNPFNPETWIPYQLAAASSVRIHIYDSMGQQVRTLDLGQQRAGAYLSRNRAAYWDGRNASGERVATGVYFYRLETEDFTATRRMVIVK